MIIILELPYTTSKFLIIFLIFIIAFVVYNVLSKEKNKRKLLKYLSSLKEIKDIEFNERHKQLRIILFDISKKELLKLAENIYSIGSRSIKDMKITYDESKSIDNPFVITISFKEKFSMEGYGFESVSLTGEQQNGFKEYSVLFKFGGTFYDDKGDLIFHTSINDHFVYKLKGEPNRCFNKLFEL